MSNEKMKFYRKKSNVLLCLVLILTIAFTASCASNTNGDGVQHTAKNADAESGEDGAGNNKKGNAGADKNGGAADDDDTDDGNDDSGATTQAASYSPEIQAQLDSFYEAASKLPLDDVPSAAVLLKTYRDLAMDGPVNDALFFAYEEHMQFVCEGINSVYEGEPPDDDTINDALENGFLYITEESNSAYFILRPDFLKYTFAETVSAKVQALLNLLAKHYDYHNGHDFIENETLMVTLDQLAEMIVDWENYIRVYPDVTNRSDIEVNLDYYLKIYIGSIQIENSGLYMLAGTDENNEALYKLMDEPRQSYLRFIENYPDSAACPLIAELYQIYSDKNFLYSVEVEDFFRAYGLAYDV